MIRACSASPSRTTLADVGRAAGVSVTAASAVVNGAKTSTWIAAATRKRILEAAARLNYRPNRTTLADVGRAAGVSVMAASAVVNGAGTSTRIAAATRERILEAAARLEYQPNAAVRTLANRRIHTIGMGGLLRDGELDPDLFDIIGNILTAAGRNGQSTAPHTLPTRSGDELRRRRLRDGPIDGVILIGPMLSRVESRQLSVHPAFVAFRASRALENVANTSTGTGPPAHLR